jgi:gliding motility-associated-like protein
VEVSNGGICAATCKYPVSVSFDERIYLPTAFSPNGDGIDDVFTAYGKYHQIESLQVFNRWGGMVWDVRGDVPWDGTFKGQPAQAGVYVYLLRYTDTRTGEEKMKSGDVVLMR